MAASTNARASRAPALWRPAAPVRDARSKPAPNTTATIDCALNKAAAALPAKALEGNCANSVGTTQPPKALKLPHHSAAHHSGQAASHSNVADRDNFKRLGSTRRTHLGAITLFLADERPGDRTADVD